MVIAICELCFPYKLLKYSNYEKARVRGILCLDGGPR